MAHVIICSFDSDQAASNFLLQALRQPSDRLGDMFGGNENTPQPRIFPFRTNFPNGPYPIPVVPGQPPFHPATGAPVAPFPNGGTAPMPVAVPPNEQRDAHELNTMHDEDVQCTVEEAARTEPGIVPPALTIPPMPSADELNPPAQP